MIVRSALTMLGCVTILVSEASAAEPNSGFDFMGLLPLILIFGVMYFILIRPQQKKSKTHREMLERISRGDRVVMNGGLIGEVEQVIDEKEVYLEIAEGVRVRVMRSMIAQLVEKTRPLSTASKTKKSKPTHSAQLTRLKTTRKKKSN